MITKKALKEKLDLYFLNCTGYRRLNGGFAEVTIKSVKKVENDKYLVEGYLESGVGDMGDGHSEKYTDTFENFFVDGKGEVIRNG